MNYLKLNEMEFKHEYIIEIKKSQERDKIEKVVAGALEHFPDLVHTTSFTATPNAQFNLVLIDLNIFGESSLECSLMHENVIKSLLENKFVLEVENCGHTFYRRLEAGGMEYEPTIKSTETEVDRLSGLISGTDFSYFKDVIGRLSYYEDEHQYIDLEVLAYLLKTKMSVKQENSLREIMMTCIENKLDRAEVNTLLGV